MANPPSASETNTALSVGSGAMILGVALEAASGTIASDSLIGVGALLVLLGAASWVWRIVARRNLKIAIRHERLGECLQIRSNVLLAGSIQPLNEHTLRVGVRSNTDLKDVRLQITRPDSAGTGWLGLKGDHTKNLSQSGEILLSARPLFFDVICAFEGRPGITVYYAETWMSENLPMDTGEEIALQAWGLRLDDGTSVHSDEIRYRVDWDNVQLTMTELQVASSERRRRFRRETNQS